MLYAIVSDIHGNLAAWNAVLADLTAMKAEKIICLGDIVGYGPQPSEVLESVYRHVDAFVMGNHDAVAAGKMSAESFNDHAREMIEWSANRVSAKGRAFLGQQPLVLKSPDFVCTHGSLDCPSAFNYILEPEEALSTFNATDASLVFIGHSHIPSICVLGASGVPHFLKSQDFEREPGKRYIVNVGSVGDPRDEDPRASYCLYNDKTQDICFRRVAFDYSAVMNAVTKAGIAPESVALLRRDPVPKREPVRETLGFAPPKDASRMATNVAESAEINSFRKSNTRLRHAIAILIIIFSASVGAFCGLATKYARKASAFVPYTPLKAVEALTPSDIWAKNLLPSIPSTYGTIRRLAAISGWRYKIKDASRQILKIGKNTNSNTPSLIIHNETRLGFELEAPPWIHNGLANGGRIQISIQAKPGKDFSGHATINVIANRGIQGEIILLQKSLNLKKAEEFQSTKSTMQKSNSLRLTDSIRRISYRIDGDFIGTLEISEPTMTVIFDETSNTKGTK